MAGTPPINRAELRKSGILDEDRFFQLLSEQYNYIDKNTAKMFYMGLVKVVVRELRTNGVCRLPHLGDMALVKQKPKSVLAGNVRKVMDGFYALKFYPKEALRIYFSKLNNLFDDKQKLDPREKILNQNI